MIILIMQSTPVHLPIQYLLFSRQVINLIRISKLYKMMIKFSRQYIKSTLTIDPIWLWFHVIMITVCHAAQCIYVSRSVETVSLCIFGRLESRTFWLINILNILSFLSATNPNWYMSHDDRSTDDPLSLSLVISLS